MTMSLFFFQAEDGIRDLVRSRGLGDVYKRQDETIAHARHNGCLLDLLANGHDGSQHVLGGFLAAVSYKHLTLPTSDLGEISVVPVTLKKKKPTITAEVDTDLDRKRVKHI